MSFSTVAGIIIAVAVVVIIFSIISAINRAQEINWLKQHGVRVLATVTGIESKREAAQVQRQVPKQHYNSTHNRWETVYEIELETEWKTYHYILAQYEHPQTHEVYQFRSNRLLHRPTQHSEGSTIPVFYDPANPGRYYMDVSR